MDFIWLVLHFYCKSTKRDIWWYGHRYSHFSLSLSLPHSMWSKFPFNSTYAAGFVSLSLEKNIQSQENCVKFGDYNEIIAIEMRLPSVMSAALQFASVSQRADAIKTMTLPIESSVNWKKLFFCLILCCHQFRHRHQPIEPPIIIILYSIRWVQIFFFDTWPRHGEGEETKNFRLVNYPWIVLPKGNVIGFYSFLFSFYFCRAIELSNMRYFSFFFCVECSCLYTSCSWFE